MKFCPNFLKRVRKIFVHQILHNQNKGLYVSNPAPQNKIKKLLLMWPPIEIFNLYQRAPFWKKVRT